MAESDTAVNQYEIAVLFHPGLEIDLDKGSGKVEKIIKDAEGKITKTDNWGKRKLAYPIAKQEFAVYVFYTAELPAPAVQQIERQLNITDEVIRFMITKLDLKAMAKAEALKAEKAKKAAERGEKADEEAEEAAQARDSGEEE
jgi:small subunit ribosomal protein S6